jgi:chromosome segregation ATPase
MGLFGTTTDERAAREQLATLTSAIEEQSRALAEVEAKLDVSKEALGLSDQIVRLKTQIADLKIEKSRIEEEQERKEREVDHKIGLERKRQEFEIEVAKRETTVTVREENLAATQQRFEEQMAFHKDQIKGEIDRFQNLLNAVIDRLPSASIEVTRTQTQGTRARAAAKS